MLRFSDDEIVRYGVLSAVLPNTKFDISILGALY